MKLKDLQTKLNEEVKIFIGKKVNMDDFHERIEDLVSSTIKEFDKDCRYTIWKVEFKTYNNAIMIEDTRLLKLTLDLKEDKRFKYERRGVVQGLEFSIINDIFAELTSKEIIKEGIIRGKRHVLEWNKNRIEELRATADQLEKESIEIEKELQEMEKNEKEV